MKMRARPLTRLVSAIALATALTGCTKTKMRQGTLSMEPTIKKGEEILVDTDAFSSSRPERWDVVLFEAPAGSSGKWVSRIVGLPGETVEIKSIGLFINGRMESPPGRLKIGNYQLPKSGLSPNAPGPVSFPFTIPSDSYFVLGDNSGNAFDSRYWGGLAISKIIGKVPEE